MMSDPLADLLTRIRNAIMAKHDRVVVPGSRMKASVCKVLKDEGYIRSFKVIVKSASDIRIKILMKENGIVGLSRVSRPGLRVYKGYHEIPKVLSGLGISIVSTSMGVVSSRTARARKVGGEVLCNIW